MKRERNKNILKFCIFFGIGLFFIYWFLLKLEPDQKRSIWNSLQQARYGWLIGVMGSTLLSHWIRALRWNLLYRPLGYQPKVVNTYGSVIVAFMANLAFPRLGEVARCATMRSSEKIPIDHSLGTVVTERVVDVLFFLLIVAIGLMVTLGTARTWLIERWQEHAATGRSIWPFVLVLLASIAVVVLLYRMMRRKWSQWGLFQKVDHFITRCIDGIRSVMQMSRHDSILFVIYSLIIYALYILGGLFILFTFKETSHLGIGATFSIYLFGSLGMVLSQGGLGVYPVLIQSALALYGISESTGTAAGWLLWGAQNAIVILVGLAFLIYFAIVKKTNE